MAQISTIPDKSFDEEMRMYEEERLMRESVDETMSHHNHHINKQGNENFIVNGMGNDTCKRIIDNSLNKGKRKAIAELKQLNYRTPPIIVANHLKKLLDTPETVEGHWLYVAQNYTPRTINRVIIAMIKIHQEGWTTIKCPAKYFTSLIQKRAKRKSGLHASMIPVNNKETRYEKKK